MVVVFFFNSRRLKIMAVIRDARFRRPRKIPEEREPFPPVLMLCFFS